MKIFSLHLAFAVALLALAFIGYGLWYAKVAAESAVAAILTTEIEIKTEAATRAGAVLAALAKLQVNEAAIEGYLISEDNIVAFLEGLERAGASLGAHTRVVSVGVSQGESGVLAAALSVEGSFDAVMRTIGIIEYAPYAITLATIALQRPLESAVWVASVGLSVGSAAKADETSPTPTSPLP